MEKQIKMLDENDETLNADVLLNLKDSNEKSQDYSVEKTPGIYFKLTGTFKSLPQYLSTVLRKINGG